MAKTKQRSPVTGLRINTPADFCSALGAHSHSIAVWTKLRGEQDQILRRTLDSMFKDLAFVDALDPESVSDFLNDVESPLVELQQMGFQLFLITARAKRAIPPVVRKAREQIADWRHNNYIVAPDPAYFWLKSPGRRRTVHMLSVACREGLQELTAPPENGIHVYPTIRQLSAAFEGEIPWCPICFLESTRPVTS